MIDFGNSGRGRATFGVGVSIAPNEIPDEFESVTYESFKGGLDMSDAPEDTPLVYGVLCLDMEVSLNDRLIRAPGILELSNEPQSLQYIFQQASLDYNVELVAIAPPWLGYKGSGAWTWVNLGLAATGLFGWNALDYLGDLLFSNGVNASYSRAPGAAVVTNQSANVIARTFAQQFGRIFAGHYTSGGATQAIGMKWNDTTGLIGGWAGAGSGNTLLFSPDGSADHIVATRALGYDLLAILMRNSLWAGYPTGLSNRPADFRFRIGGVGCASERTARVTPGGVTFLSDDGVVNYNVNSSEIISAQINSEIIPLDYFNLLKYTAAYTPRGRRYYLQTPSALYIYEFAIPEINRPARWFKRSTVVDSIIGFSDQAASVAWDALVGSWDSQTQSWDTFGMPGWAAPSAVYYALATHFGKEDPSIFTRFGQALTPRWRTPQMNRKAITDQITTVGWEIAYVSSADSQVKFMVPDKNGDLNNSVTKVLPSTNGAIRRKLLWCQDSRMTGLGLQTQMEVISGSPEILRLRQLYTPSGPVVGSIN